jgi:hypothetical protein
MAVGYQKISVNLSEQVVDTLREMAVDDSVTVTEVLRRAVSTHKFIEDAQREGKAIYVRDLTTNESERVIFR